MSTHHLGSMEKPIKVTAEGRTFYLCCEGCEEEVKSRPQGGHRQARQEGKASNPLPAVALVVRADGLKLACIRRSAYTCRATTLAAVARDGSPALMRPESSSCTLKSELSIAPDDHHDPVRVWQHGHLLTIYF